MDAGAMLFLMIAVAVFMGCAIPIVAIWAKHKEKVAQILVDSNTQDTIENGAQAAAENRRVEERLRVLERIVTDKGHDIAGQIEMLRDTHEINTQIDNLGEPSRTLGK